MRSSAKRTKCSCRWMWWCLAMIRSSTPSFPFFRLFITCLLKSQTIRDCESVCVSNIVMLHTMLAVGSSVCCCHSSAFHAHQLKREMIFFEECQICICSSCIGPRFLLLDVCFVIRLVSNTRTRSTPHGTPLYSFVHSWGWYRSKHPRCIHWMRRKCKWW